MSKLMEWIKAFDEVDIRVHRRKAEGPGPHIARRHETFVLTSEEVDELAELVAHLQMVMMKSVRPEEPVAAAPKAPSPSVPKS